MTEDKYGKLECNEEMEQYLARKISKHKFNKDNKPFTRRELRLIKRAFAAGFEHRYWKERRRHTT